MNTDFIKETQRRINKMMETYESITRQLLNSDIDDILMLTEKRRAISEEITALDIRIKKECREDERALLAYLNKCDRSSLPEEFMEIFDLRQEFNAMAFRVKNLEPEIKERITMMKENLMKKIREHNSGQNAKAAKYAQAGVNSGENFYFPENKKKI